MKSRTLTVNVTQSHIDRAVDMAREHTNYDVCENCPIALAIKDMGYPAVSWGYDMGRVDDTPTVWLADPNSQLGKWVFNFDDTLTASPITFTITEVIGNG